MVAGQWDSERIHGDCRRRRYHLRNGFTLSKADGETTVSRECLNQRKNNEQSSASAASAAASSSGASTSTASALELANLLGEESEALCDSMSAGPGGGGPGGGGG